MLRTIVIRINDMYRTINAIYQRTSYQCQVKKMARDGILLTQPINFRTSYRRINEVKGRMVTFMNCVVFLRLCGNRYQVRERGAFVIARIRYARSNFCVGLSRYNRIAGAREFFSIQLVECFTIGILTYRRFNLFLISINGNLTCFFRCVYQLFICVPMNVNSSQDVESSSPRDFLIRNSTFHFCQTRSINSSTSISGKR